MTTKLKSTISYFVLLGKKSKNNDLTNKKLQKLLYYSQAWNMVLRDKPLFKEDFEAWIHGPAIPEVYKKYRSYGCQIIDEDIDEKDFKQLSKDDKNILDEIWKVYGKYDATYLELLSHNEDPWQNARNGHMPYESSTAVIAKNDIKEYYGQKAQ